MKKFLVLLGAILIVQTISLKADEEDIIWMKETHYNYYVEFSPNSNLLLTLGNHPDSQNRKGVIIFNTEGDTVKVIYNSEGLNLNMLEGIFDAHFSRDGQFLILMWDYGSMPYHRMEIYSTTTWERIKVIDMPGVLNEQYSSQIVISPDNRTIVGIISRGFYFYNVESGELIKHAENVAEGKNVSAYNAVYSKDGRYIYFTTSEGKLRFLNTSTYQVDYTYDAGYGNLAISKDGNMIAFKTGLSGQAVQIMNPASKEIIRTIPGSATGVSGIAFSNNDNYLGVSYQYATVMNIYNIQSSVISKDFTNTSFGTLSFSNDDKYIITHAAQYLILLSNNITSVNDDKDNTEFNVLYPNPTTNTVNVKFKLNLPAFTKIIVYDNTGREVKSVFQGHLDYGEQNIKADIWDLRAGNYFL
ncbi:MAG: T9SS type A sorting domain-containing protein [Candidatus Kapabacteria bacterium]|nr:T9SS type A sorting domain-containing protein [Candidatus Kapabacteria bacterium]